MGRGWVQIIQQTLVARRRCSMGVPRHLMRIVPQSEPFMSMTSDSDLTTLCRHSPSQPTLPSVGLEQD
jgi:hypothetical protein